LHDAKPVGGLVETAGFAKIKKCFDEFDLLGVLLIDFSDQ
jgi:hypothetical protein